MAGTKKRVVIKDDAHIKVLAKKNPRRQGSGRYNRFEHYKGNPTVASVLKKKGKGINRRGIRRDVRDGVIQLVA